MNRSSQKSVIVKSERYLPALKQWADKGIYRTPLDNSLLINYPPITTASKVTPDNYFALEQALSSLRSGCGVTLYIHIPFCSRRCTYCNYYAKVKDSVPDSYIALLKEDLKLYQNILGQKQITVNSIYIGGGTPSLLSVAQIETLLTCINKDFSSKPGMEVSMEFHPEIINAKGVADYIKALPKLGINRVSIGIQSLDDKVLGAINRGHTKKEALAVLDLVLKQNFSKVNVDIIYGGLAYESMDSVYDTLKTLASFKPTNITKHFCEIKKGSVDFNRYKTDADLYPDWAENIRTQTLINMLLKERGYQKEMLHMHTDSSSLFSHQKQKWGSKETVLLALGPGTYGWVFQDNAVKDVVMYKTFSLKRYREMVLGGVIPLERLAILNKDESARRHIQYALNYGYLDKAYLQSLLSGVSDKTGEEVGLLIGKLKKHGFFDETRHKYRITPLGEYLSDEIKALFASRQVLNHKTADNSHAAHHWYPNMNLVKRFKEIILN